MGRLFRAEYARELEDELRFHVDELTDEYTDAGLDPGEARRKALVKLGNPQRIREDVRELSWPRYFTDLFRDLRFAIRSLRRAGHITAVAVSALALGIAFSATVFSVVYNGVLRPFPYRAADRLASIEVGDPKSITANSDDGQRRMFTLEEVAAFRADTRDFEDVAGYTTWYIRYIHDGGAEVLHGGALTPNAMDFFGMRPILGRALTPADSQPSAAPVVLLNYHFWKDRFRGDASVLGKTLDLGARPRTIVGVMPPRFQLLGSDVYLPAPWQTSQLAESEPDYYFANAILRKGVSRKSASAGLTAIVQQLMRQNPKDYPDHPVAIARDWSEALYAGYERMFFLLAAAVGLLLVISCSNAAGLLLVHASSRQKEMAVRIALGARRQRLIRQFLAESLVLASAGCLLGCVLTWGALSLIAEGWLARGVFCGEADVHLNWPTLILAVCVSFFATIAAGLAPAIVSLRGDLQKQLGSNGVGVHASFRGGGFRSALVIGQVALSVVLLVSAGLVTRTFVALTHVDYGIRSTNLLFAWAPFPKAKYKTGVERSQYIDQLIPKIEALPGVVSATEAFGIPLFAGPDSTIDIVGKPHQGRWTSMIDACTVDYFKTLGLQLLRGRLLSQDDIAATRNVTVVNQQFARKYFGAQDPMGRQIEFDLPTGNDHAPRKATFSIIGVVSDFRNAGLESPIAPQAIIPHSFIPADGFGFLVRTQSDPNLQLNSIRRVMWSMDPEITLTEPWTLDKFLDERTYAKPRFGVVSFAVCAGVGLLLSLIGIFTITAYTVSLMTHEIGIRMALGARPGDVLDMVLRKCLKVVGIGIALGLAVALAVVPLLRSQLWGVSAFDGITFTIVVMLLIGAGALASYLPALRAVRIDPNTALRAD